MEMLKSSRPLHVEFSGSSSSVCEGLTLGKEADKLATAFAGALFFTFERQCCFEETRKAPVRHSARKPAGRQWRRIPVPVVAFFLTSLIGGLVPLTYYLIAWISTADSLHSPAQTFHGLSLGLSSSFPRSSEDIRPSLKPQLIPRLIHQTFKSAGSLPEKAEQLRRTWRDRNPGWALKLWDDEACKSFVRLEFPEYYEAYMGLPKDVERADFFRYLVVFKYGGVYADIDTECKIGMDNIIRASDTLLVGWEAEVPNSDAALRRHFSRMRQVQQWMFAGVPGHPALQAVCEHIRANYARQFSQYTNMDTLERTGPGAWTDAILNSAVKTGNAQDPWHIRVLPQVATGVHPKGTSGINPHTKGIVVQHHFLGSWKKKGGWRKFGIIDNAKKLLGWAAKEPAAAVHVTVKESNVRHYPVSIGTAVGFPSFTILVDLIGRGDVQSREEAGSVLTKFGNWQAGSEPMLEPYAVNAVVGSLGVAADQSVFVDIGAGIGFFSLYAAAHGHHVIATELSPRSLASFTASVQFNAFGNLISVSNVSTGSSRGEICTQPLNANETLSHWRHEEVQRGYAHPNLHKDTTPDRCGATAQRLRYEDLVPHDANVKAVRISAGAWTSAVLRSALPSFKAKPPNVVFIEMDVAEMERAGFSDIEELLRQMREVGYTDMSHAGAVCSDRWERLTHDLRKQSKVSPVQPMWCNLSTENGDDFAEVVQKNRELGAAPMTAASKPDTPTSAVELVIMVYTEPEIPPNLKRTQVQASNSNQHTTGPSADDAVSDSQVRLRGLGSADISGGRSDTAFTNAGQRHLSSKRGDKATASESKSSEADAMLHDVSSRALNGLAHAPRR